MENKYLLEEKYIVKFKKKNFFLKEELQRGRRQGESSIRYFTLQMAQHPGLSQAVAKSLGLYLGSWCGCRSPSWVGSRVAGTQLATRCSFGMLALEATA